MRAVWNFFSSAHTLTSWTVPIWNLSRFSDMLLIQRFCWFYYFLIWMNILCESIWRKCFMIDAIWLLSFQENYKPTRMYCIDLIWKCKCLFTLSKSNCLSSVFHLLSICIQTPLKIGEICKLHGNLYDIIKMVFTWFLILFLHLNKIIKMCVK